MNSCFICGDETGDLDNFQDGFAIAKAHELCFLRREVSNLKEKNESLELANGRLREQAMFK